MRMGSRDTCFEYCETLSQRARELVRQFGIVTDSRQLIVAIAARSLSTFDAVALLAREGYGSQVEMLNRSLLEDALHIYWVADHPDVALQKADEHMEAVSLGDRAIDGEFVDIGRPPGEFSEEESERLDAFLKRYKSFSKSWTEASDAELRDCVKSTWPDGERYIDWIYAVVQRRNNLVLHNSPHGLMKVFGASDSGEVDRTLPLKPDGNVREPLMQAFSAFYLVVRLLAEMLDQKDRDLERLFVDGTASFDGAWLLVPTCCSLVR